MRWFVTVGARTFEVELSPEGMRVDGTLVDADLARVENSGRLSLMLDGASYGLLARRDGGGRWEMHVSGRRYLADVVDERTRVIREMTVAASGPQGPRPVRAPMPGLVVKVEVAEGDRVEAGHGLVIVEAMKMENELKAEAPGVVARIHVQAGEAVEKDQVLVDFAKPEEAPAEEAPAEAAPAGKEEG
jgi:acetyl/propionyl-CoA carboxylase alpha subunit